MIDSPSENVKLTFDQLQQIDVTKKQLANLQSEIANAIKLVKVNKLEMDKITKEKQYQEQLFVELELKVKELQKHHSNLLVDIENDKKNLNEINEKMKSLTEEHKKKSDALEISENKHKLDIIEHEKKVGEYNIQSTKLESDKLAVKSVQDAFSKVIEQIPW